MPVPILAGRLARSYLGCHISGPVLWVGDRALGGSEAAESAGPSIASMGFMLARKSTVPVLMCAWLPCHRHRSSSLQMQLIARTLEQAACSKATWLNVWHVATLVRAMTSLNIKMRVRGCGVRGCGARYNLRPAALMHACGVRGCSVCDTTGVQLRPYE